MTVRRTETEMICRRVGDSLVTCHPETGEVQLLTGVSVPWSERGTARRAVLQAAMAAGGIVVASTVLPASAAAATGTGNYRQLVLASAPVAYYRLDDAAGSDTAADASGHANDGRYVAVGYTPASGTTTPRSAQNDATGATTDGNGALLASNIYAYLPNVLAAATAFSLEFWMLSTDVDPGRAGGYANRPQWFTGFGLVDGETSGNGADFGTALVSGYVVFGVGGDDQTIYGPFVADSAYHHVVATWASGSSMTLYVDGVMRVSSATGVPAGPRSFPPNLAIGTLRSTDEGLYGVTVDEVAIYDRQLTSGDVMAHYQAR